MARELRDALPGGEQPLHAAVWAFMRPILSPRLAELNKDAFVFDGGVKSSVDLDSHRADTDLDELDLDNDDDHEAAAYTTPARRPHALLGRGPAERLEHPIVRAPPENLPLQTA